MSPTAGAAAADVRVDEVAERLHRVVLPLPYDPRTVNAYVELPADGDDVLLVDAGTDDPACLAALDAALARLGVDPGQVADVAVTHAHVDHYGLAGHFAREHGARVWMHPTETLILERHWRAGWWVPEFGRYLRRHGVDGELAERLAALEDWTGTLTPLDAFRPLEHGDVLRGPSRAWEVVHTPGHTAGHVALWNPESRLLLGGDHVLEVYSPHLRDAPGEMPDALAAYLRALDELVALEPALTFPGHGDPIADTAAAAGELRRGHDDVLARVLALLDRPRTAHDVTLALHGDSLPDFHLRLALPQTLVYLRHLELRGDAHQHLDGGVVHYRATPAPGRGEPPAGDPVRLDDAF